MAKKTKAKATKRGKKLSGRKVQEVKPLVSFAYSKVKVS